MRKFAIVYGMLVTITLGVFVAKGINYPMLYVWLGIFVVLCTGLAICLSILSKRMKKRTFRTFSWVWVWTISVCTLALVAAVALKLF